MDGGPQEQETAAAAPEPRVMDPEQAARKLSRFITCGPSAPPRGCGGLGWVYVLRGTMRHKAVCPCIQREFDRQKAQAQAAAQAQGKLAAELVAEAEALPAAPPPARHVPAGARERLATLTREIGKEEARLTAMREKVGTAIAGVADELAALEAEEQANARGQAEAEAARKLAGEQLEETRARLEGLRADVGQATATHDRLRNEAGQFGARRMELEKRMTSARARLSPGEADSEDRLKGLRYRLDGHLARWPELREAPPS